METEKTLAEKFREAIGSRVNGLAPLGPGLMHDIDTIIGTTLSSIDPDADFGLYRYREFPYADDGLFDEVSYFAYCSDRSVAILTAKHNGGRLLADIVSIRPAKTMTDAEKFAAVFKKLTGGQHDYLRTANALIEEFHGVWCSLDFDSDDNAEVMHWKLIDPEFTAGYVFPDGSVAIIEFSKGIGAYVHLYLR